MDLNTKLHVLWGVYNNPLTPENKKEQAAELLRAAVAVVEPNKLTAKINAKLGG